LRGKILLEYEGNQPALDQLYRIMENEFCTRYGTQKYCEVTKLSDKYDDYWTKKQHLTYKIYANQFCGAMVDHRKRPCECHNNRWCAWDTNIWDTFANPQFNYSEHKHKVEKYKENLSQEDKKHEDMENTYCVGLFYGGYYNKKKCQAIYHSEEDDKIEYDQEICEKFCDKVRKEDEYHENANCEVISETERRRRLEQKEIICTVISAILVLLGAIGYIYTNSMPAITKN
jgi:hypothetical protein